MNKIIKKLFYFDRGPYWEMKRRALSLVLSICLFYITFGQWLMYKLRVIDAMDPLMERLNGFGLLASIALSIWILGVYIVDKENGWRW